MLQKNFVEPSDRSESHVAILWAANLRNSS
jgi:hypothetical protein